MLSRRLHTVVLVFGMALPLLMGQGCPGVSGNGGGGGGGGLRFGGGTGNRAGGGIIVGPVGGAPQPITLFSATRTRLGPGYVFVGKFNPTSIGQVINVTVIGNGTLSRPIIQVLDAAGNVLGIEGFPVSNTTTLTYTSTSVGDQFIFADEVGFPAAFYTITATLEP